METVEVKFGTQVIGGNNFALIAGPCSIESEEQFATVAQKAQDVGSLGLRGGVFKLRTRPDSFQGLGSEALKIARAVKQQVRLPFVSEITDVRQISDLEPVVDMFQVGSRNMYNYALLKELALIEKPVLLKRGFSATVDEWLLAAEYVLKGGKTPVVLCERGIRTFETKTRNTLDLSSVAYLKWKSPLPILVDPSHGTGVPELISPMSKAAAAAGADGIIVEVHPDPSQALSDGFQALTLDQFDSLVSDLHPLLRAIGRPLENHNG